MHALFRISFAIDRVLSAIGKVAAWLAVPMMLIIIFDVFYRKFGGQGSTKLQEMEWHLHATLFLLCFAFAYLKDAHVRIELVRDKMSRNLRAWLEILGTLLFLVPYTVIVTKFGLDFVHDSYMNGEVSSALTGLPYRWIIKAMIPIGMIMLLLAGIAVLLRNIVFLFGPSELREACGTHVGVHPEFGPDSLQSQHRD